MKLGKNIAGVVAAACVTAAFTAPIYAQEVIKLGLSVPLSGSGANWGKGSEWLCNEAAKDVKEGGGVKVGGKVYNFQCIAYDNKYNAAEGTKVAQTLLKKDETASASATDVTSVMVSGWFTTQFFQIKRKREHAEACSRKSF